MKKKESDRELRRKAEEKVVSQPSSTGETDVKRLLHELQVNQIELELQSEELRLAKQGLREQKTHFRKVIEETHTGYFRIGLDGRFQYVNGAWLRMHGYDSPEEVIGRHFSMTQVDRDIESAQQIVNMLLKGTPVPSGEFTRRCKDGSIFYHTFSANPLVQEGVIVGLEGFLIDIAELKEKEKYINLSRDVLKILNSPGNIQDSLRSVVACLKSELEFDAVGIRFQSGNDFPFIAYDGFPKDFLLRENTLLERAVDGGLCRDKDGNICLECTCGLVISGKTDPANPLFTATGSCWTNDSFPIPDIPPDMDPRLHPRNECIHLGYASIALIPIRIGEKIVGLILLNDKLKNRFTLNSVELLEAIGTHIGSYMLRKQVEEEKMLFECQSQQAQRLESLGVLAGGIAHNFNNILAAIVGYCGLIKLKHETAVKNIPEIEKAAERAAGLCLQMMAYAGKAQPTKTRVNIVMEVDDIVCMLKSTLPQNAVIKTDFSAKIPLIECDAIQLRQVVMNLIINASEAIGTEQGEVNVSLASIKVESGKPYEDYHGKAIPPGEYVCLEVTDNGCGMDEEIKWRIFEPFYTTKFTGRGLGMSAVRGIIKSHAGALQLFSQLGHGTTFKVYFPALTNEFDGDEVQTVSVPASPWFGTGTILLAEDEEQIRSIAKEMLQIFGFTVLEAVNGKEALDIYLKNSAEITLVVTDMGMPVMDGYELFSELRKLNSELPIIISSGFGDTEVSARIGIDNIAGIISKPYNMNQLQEILKSVVAGTASTKA